MKKGRLKPGKIARAADHGASSQRGMHRGGTSLPYCSIEAAPKPAGWKGSNVKGYGKHPSGFQAKH